jgi:hypothetical protein
MGEEMRGDISVRSGAMRRHSGRFIGETETEPISKGLVAVVRRIRPKSQRDLVSADPGRSDLIEEGAFEASVVGREAGRRANGKPSKSFLDRNSVGDVGITDMMDGPHFRRDRSPRIAEKGDDTVSIN